MDRITEKRGGHNIIPLRQDGKHKWALCPAGQGDAPAEYLYGDHADRLAAYEDTGLEPEGVDHVKLALMGKAIAEIKEFDGVPIDRLRALLQAEKDGLLVVLDEPRKPLVWGDDSHDTILCPNCKHDLMGGFPEADSGTPMYQCPYCGQPIDGTKALTREEAETALSKANTILCKHGIGRHTNELGEDEIYCELTGRWMNVTLGDCLGNCEAEAALEGGKDHA